MKILVVDVAASSGGAISILKMFISKAKLDSSNEYYFCLSTDLEIEASPNIKLLKFPNSKNWIGRLIFDNFKIKKLVKKYSIERILSLQNIGFKHVKNIEQHVYLHQSLPFSDLKVNIFKNPIIWVYKHIIGSIIKKNLRYADLIIVQSNWMKNEVEKVTGENHKLIKIEKPDVGDMNPSGEKSSSECKYFFYPADPYFYKNFDLIVESLIEMKTDKFDFKDFKFYLTCSGNENKYIKKIRKTVEKLSLPVIFGGRADKQKMIEMYKNSILIFVSKLETVGLPLLEMAQFSGKIISIDEPYSQEALESYNKDNVVFIKNKIDFIRAIKETIYSYDKN